MAERPADPSDRAAVLAYVDRLYEDEKWREVLRYLEEVLGSAGDDPELTWRLLRSAFRLGQQSLTSGDSGEAERIADRALEMGQRALKKEDGNYALHKWLGIHYRLIGDIKGMKAKIEFSYKIKEHFLRAAELNPEDQSVNHLLGRWCYRITSVTWLQRKMASAILATPPTSSYEEALQYFEAAEKPKPGFFKANWLWLGKVLLQLKRKSEAKQWLQKLVDSDVSGVDDTEAKEEAKQLLIGL